MKIYVKATSNYDVYESIKDEVKDVADKLIKGTSLKHYINQSKVSQSKGTATIALGKEYDPREPSDVSAVKENISKYSDIKENVIKVSRTTFTRGSDGVGYPTYYDVVYVIMNLNYFIDKQL